MKNQYLLGLLTLLLTNTVWAAPAAQQGQAPSIISQALLFGGFIAIFYFLIWRPQSKRAKEHRDLIGKLEKGDEVVTTGGILGSISKVSDDFLVLAIADNMEIKIQKHAISACLPKGTIKNI